MTPTGDEAAAFGRLHPAVQYHVVNSLGWRSLTPVQRLAVEPVLRGDHVLALAGTAGGKTEAALFPLLSRMLTEGWQGLSVLYVCPLRALLNNLHPRIDGFCRLVGRRAGLWHGDVGPAERRRLLTDPPDILLTTPESIESMLVSTGVDERRWFSAVRAVVVDEAHAFVGDDRGWHLVAVLTRVAGLAGRELQRVALSATIGNPQAVLGHLTRTCTGLRTVVDASPPAGARPEVTLDFVGSLPNAALVISRLHRGEKRLVFVDSRARAEHLAVALRDHGVTTFVSHGSLGVAERRAAEQAFAEARDCVIVATSTLELGIDVGDLDRVIQIDAPPSVASFLQRLGRTGRRPGTVRTTLCLATEDEELVRAAAVLWLWSQGFVEPIEPPPSPHHLVAQQCLAVCLQEGAVGRARWPERLGSPFVFGEGCRSRAAQITDYLLERGYLVDDGGLISIGGAAEQAFGRRHFLELLSVFTSPPLLSVRHGRTEIGLVPDDVLLIRPAGAGAGGPSALLLAGSAWQITDVDWTRRIVQVEPTSGEGVARWDGGGVPLSGAVARAARTVLAGADPEGVTLSRRATERLAAMRAEHAWVRDGATTLVRGPGTRQRLWTFGGWRANLWLAAGLARFRTTGTAVDGLTVAIDADADVGELRAAICDLDPSGLHLEPAVLADAVDQLKFSDCLPPALATATLEARLRDDASLRIVCASPVDVTVLT